MATGCVATPLLLLLAANDWSTLDCFCDRIANVTADGDLIDLGVVSAGEEHMWYIYCNHFRGYKLKLLCHQMEQLFAASVMRAVSHLASAGRCGEGEVEGLGDVSAAIGGLTYEQVAQLAKDLKCLTVDDCIHSCSIQGLDDNEWNETALAADHVRRPALRQLLRAAWRVTRAVTCRNLYAYRYEDAFLRNEQHLEKAEFQAAVPAFLAWSSGYWRDSARLLSMGMAHLSRLLVPLAFEHLGRHTTDEQLHGWLRSMGRVRDLLITRLSTWARDMQFISEQVTSYRVEEDSQRPGSHLMRLPLLSHYLLLHEERFLTLGDDFGAVCSQQQPAARRMLGLAEAIFAFCRKRWLGALYYYSPERYISEEWEPEDQGDTWLSVDTGCLQLLVEALEQPACPLEEPPVEAARRRRRCRLQLWQDVVERPPPLPVTSYLAYTQRAGVSLCLLAWMASNSRSICQDVPFSTIQSVHDARCYFNNPEDESCLRSNATDAICSVSRAILKLACSEFSSEKPLNVCSTEIAPFSGYYSVEKTPYVEFKPTEKTLNYKNSLNSFTLKYKDFKIESLKPLEISFVTLNIVFRLLTAGVYASLPQLRNLPGKILLSFQVTGIVQLVCSEVLCRMAGVLALSAAVLVDSALTLLGCLWLNAFCFQMHACVRHLRLPNHMSPAESNRAFRRLAMCTLIPWTILCTASFALEYTNKYYLLHSRIISIVGISLSVSLNFVFLGLLARMYLRTKNAMQQLEIVTNDKFCSKKELMYLSVKAVFLSGTGTIIRIGFHQTQGIAQFVYWVHIATMVQGPVLFVFFVCNSTALPLLKHRVLSWWNPSVVSPGQELCSSAERNLAKKTNEQHLPAESSLL